MSTAVFAALCDIKILLTPIHQKATIIIMDSPADYIFNHAMQLPDSDRAELAARLIESLDPEVDQNLDAAWNNEINRRIKEIDSGKVTTIPWPEARKMILGASNESSTD